MHGLIVHEFRRFIEDRSSPPIWRSIARATGLPRVADISENYPDDRFVEALLLAASKSDVAVTTLLFEFGQWLVPPLLTVYGVFVDPRWNLLDVLEHTEHTMHRAVRLRDPAAAPPTLHVERVGPGQVEIVYQSERRLCALARGIVAGLAEHFDTEVHVTEPTCMHRGDPGCRLSVVVGEHGYERDGAERLRDRQ